MFGAQISRVLFNLLHAGILRQTPDHLFGGDIHRIDELCAMGQQAIGEASGRCADVQACFSRDVDAEIFERAFEFQSATARVFWRVAADFNLRVGGHLRACFVAARAIYADFSRENQCLCFFARVGESALDNQYVEALLLGFWFGWHGKCVQ